MLNKNKRMRTVNRTYRHRVEIWDLSGKTENKLGETVQVPLKLYDLYCDVIPVRGKEYIEQDKLVPEMQYKLITRYRKELDQSMVIKWQGRELNIKAIVDIDGEEREMEILCIEEVDTK